MANHSFYRADFNIATAPYTVQRHKERGRVRTAGQYDVIYRPTGEVVGVVSDHTDVSFAHIFGGCGWWAVATQTRYDTFGEAVEATISKHR